MAKPPKPKPPEPTRGREIARASGDIAGMPRSFDDALKSLADISARSQAARATAGILTQRQDEILERLAGEIRLITGSLERMWREVDSIIQEGIALPEKKTLAEVELL